MMKNCISMQCATCGKSIQSHVFNSHLEQCIGSSMVSLREKTQPDFNRDNLHITVSQTVIK